MANKVSYQHAIDVYISHLKTEEKYLRQKSCIKWLTKGDENIASFHSHCLSKYTNLCIHIAQNSSGRWRDQEGNIE